MPRLPSGVPSVAPVAHLPKSEAFLSMHSRPAQLKPEANGWAHGPKHAHNHPRMITSMSKTLFFGWTTPNRLPWRCSGDVCSTLQESQKKVHSHPFAFFEVLTCSDLLCLMFCVVLRDYETFLNFFRASIWCQRSLGISKTECTGPSSSHLQSLQGPLHHQYLKHDSQKSRTSIIVHLMH